MQFESSRCCTGICRRRHVSDCLIAQDVYHNPDNLKRSLLNRASTLPRTSIPNFTTVCRDSLFMPELTPTSTGDHRQQRQPCTPRHGGQAPKISHFLQILRPPSAHVRALASLQMHLFYTFADTKCNHGITS